LPPTNPNRFTSLPKGPQIVVAKHYGHSVTTSNNPAGRLHNLLTMGRTQMDTRSALVAWTQTWGYESPHGTPIVLRRGADMIEMAADTRRRIERLPDEAGPSLLSHFGEVESTVNGFTNLTNQQMVQFMSLMKDTSWQCLQTCDWMLKREDPDPMLDDDTVAALAATVSDLLKDVKFHRTDCRDQVVPGAAP
jgi:hypothetical protein